MAGVIAERMLFGSDDRGAERDVKQVEPIIDEIVARKGEERSRERIMQDLIAETESHLERHQAALRAISEEGDRRAREHGFLNLHRQWITLFTDEELRRFFGSAISG